MNAKRNRSWIAAALLGALGPGCAPDLPTQLDPDGVRFLRVTGEWEYTASDMRLTGSAGAARCEITGVRLSITKQEKGAGAFSGRSSAGQLTCNGDLSFLSGPVSDFPLGKGYTFNQFVAFDLGTPEWRHDGQVTTTDSVSAASMSGSFKLNSGGLLFEGKFQASRLPGR